MHPVDIREREAVLEQSGNIVIRASAGTGKTYTTIQRILSDRRRQTNYQTFAAITFTRKASKEISSRLGPNKGDGFVGTNDTFVLTEIIQPFMYDVYGLEFKAEIKPDYSNANQVKTFSDGVEKIRLSNLMCKYVDMKKNFSFQLALDILKKSASARMYLISKYFRIYIDEYQDSDIDMHNLFMYIAEDLAIPMFIVGDEKQSIYGWRGAYSTGFTGLFDNPSFATFKLQHNFRSVIPIQNYANIFMESVRGYYQPTEFSDEVILCKASQRDTIANFISTWIESNKNCAFLNFSNDDAKTWRTVLNSHGLNFTYIPPSPLENSEYESEHVWIARAIATYHHGKTYSEYDFMDEIPMPDAYKLKDIRCLLEQIEININDLETFGVACRRLYAYLGYVDSIEIINKEISLLFSVVNNIELEPTYNQDAYKHTTCTIHSSKGLEFKQVIINASNYDFSRNGTKDLHYVAVTRPEERLLIIAYDSMFRRYKKYIDDAIVATQKLGCDVEISQVIRTVEL